MKMAAFQEIDKEGLSILVKKTGDNELQILVPEELKTDVLIEAHGSRIASHQGWNGTYKRIRSAYYWPGLWKDVGHNVLPRSRLQPSECPKFRRQGTASITGNLSHGESYH